MSKLETVKSLAQQRSKAISEQIRELKTLQTQSVESLAQQIEPLAQSLAALSDEARTAILQIVETATQRQKANAQQISAAATKWSEAAKSVSQERKQLREATSDLQQATYTIKKHSKSVSLKVWTAAIVSSLALALALLTAYMVWQPPLSPQEKAAVKYFNAISPDGQQKILQIVKDNNL